MAAAAARSSSSAAWKTAAASLPLLVWARDSLFGVCRVRGTSMEPALQDGDVVLVRKFETGVILSSLVQFWWGGGNNSNHNSGGGANDDDDDGDDDAIGKGAAVRTSEPHERARLRRYEQLQGCVDYVPPSRLYEHPPTALPGHVVVFKDPESFVASSSMFSQNNGLCIKRVVGLGGQWMRVAALSTNSSTSRAVDRRRLQSLPPFTLHVQGDNPSNNSRDSRHYGSISKNLLVGIAEYVVWPPTRWQRIPRIPIKDDRGRPLAFWP